MYCLGYSVSIERERERERERGVTSEKAKAEAEAAAGADSEGGTELPEIVGFHFGKLPEQTLVIVVSVHLPPTILVPCSSSTQLNLSCYTTTLNTQTPNCNLSLVNYK